LKNDRVYWYGIDIGVLASVFLASVVPMAPFSALLDGARPQMTNLHDIGVARKIESSEYQPYACDSIFRAP